MALLVGVTAAASLAGLGEGPPTAYWVAAAVVLTVMAGLALDAFGGTVVGIAGAAALVALRRVNGDWTLEDFTPAVVETLAVCVAGAMAGATGSALRGHGLTAAPVLQPAFGSLGLLGADAAMARLEEEVARAVAHRRPLSLVVFDIRIIHSDLPESGVEAAQRAVARIAESRAGESDVPFALSQDRLGIILPEASTATAWDVVGAILEAVGNGRFVFGPERTQKSLADSVHVHVGLAHLGSSNDSWDALLDTAVAAVEASGREEDVT